MNFLSLIRFIRSSDLRTGAFEQTVSLSNARFHSAISLHQVLDAFDKGFEEGLVGDPVAKIPIQ